MAGKIGSLDYVQEFPDRWIGVRHGRWGAFSMWEGVGVCRWREIGPVLFRKVLHVLMQASLINNGVSGFCC